MVAEKWKDRLTDQLCKAILALETEEEVYRFLEDNILIRHFQEE